METVLALDIAKRSGWALYEQSEGAATFGGVVCEGGGGRQFLEFARWLNVLIEKHQPTVLFHEEVFVGSNPQTALGLCGRVAIAQMMACQARMVVRGFRPSEWRKPYMGFAGGGRAKLKAGAIAAAKARGFDVGTDDDAADAIGIMDYGMQTLGIERPWGNSQIEVAAIRAAKIARENA